MDTDKAFYIIEALANGADPFTGETLSEYPLLNHPDVIRAFFTILSERNKAKDVPVSIKAPKPAKLSYKKEQERRKYNIANGFPECHGFPWTPNLTQDVIKQYRKNGDIVAIAKSHGRKPGAIINLLQKNNVIDTTEAVILSDKFNK